MVNATKCKWAAGLVVGVTAILGCGGTSTPSSVAPTPSATPDAAVSETPDEPNAVEWSALKGSTPAADAPPGLAQFGRLVGAWVCTTEQRQPDGTWKAGPGSATWTWFYTLGGYAVQDIWEPVKGAVGTNLRVYNAAEDAWEIQWVTGSLTTFQTITAKAAGDDMIMHSDAPAAGSIPAHASRITFFDISPDAFEWKYEATKLGADTGWTEFSRLHCKRAAVPSKAR